MVSYEKILPDININPLLFQSFSFQNKSELNNTYNHEHPHYNKQLGKFANGESKLTEDDDHKIGNGIQKHIEYDIESNGHNGLLSNVNPLFHAGHMSKQNSTFINCDVRYFNYDYLIEKIGYFDGINIKILIYNSNYY